MNCFILHLGPLLGLPLRTIRNIFRTSNWHFQHGPTSMTCGLAYHMNIGTIFMPYVVYLWHIQKYVDQELNMDLDRDAWGHGCLAHGGWARTLAWSSTY